MIRWTGSSRSPPRLQSTQRVAAVKPSLSCPAVPHQDHLPPGRLFGGVSPAPGRSRTSRVCRSGSAPGNALSASGRLSLYVVSRRPPVRSSVMYQLKNSVGFGIACGARTTLPRIEARACRRGGIGRAAEAIRAVAMRAPRVKVQLEPRSPPCVVTGFRWLESQVGSRKGFLGEDLPGRQSHQDDWCRLAQAFLR